MRWLQSMVFTGVVLMLSPCYGEGQEGEPTEGGEIQRQLEIQLEETFEEMNRRNQPRFARKIETTREELRRFFDFEEPRLARLNFCAEKAVDQALKNYNQACRLHFNTLDSKDQERQLKRKNLYGAPNLSKITPLEQLAWTDGIKGVLTEAELTEWEAWKQNQRTAKITAIAKLLTILIDEKIGLQSEQRSKILPILRQVADDDLSNYVKSSAYPNAVAMLSAFRNSERNRGNVAAVLTLAQRESWGDWMEVQFTSRRYLDLKPTPGSDPELIELFREKAVADTLYQMKEREVRLNLPLALAKVRDIAETVDLSHQQVAQLEWASHGQLEDQLSEWISGLDTTYHRSIANVARGEIYRRLSRMTMSRYARYQSSSALWENTLQQVLTPKQQHTWEKTLAERADYADQVAFFYLTTQLQSGLSLRQTQIDKLAPELKKSITNCSQKFNQFVPSMEPWFLTIGKLFVPFAMIPEEKTKGILTKQQIKKWESTHKRNVMNYLLLFQKAEQEQQQAIKVPEIRLEAIEQIAF